MTLFLTEDELAVRQNRSVKTIQTERQKGGGVPFRKFGRAVRYHIDDVEKWEAERTRRSTSDNGSNASASRQ
ncbi:helix-turn-helix transcriptional regulator [Devosia sp.]|uniref:helix-turn-helix transcriptional regulator n=1 Tax=Devosia sp. TaxID=1871048 RepID=UPI003F70DB0B